MPIGPISVRKRARKSPFSRSCSERRLSRDAGATADSNLLMRGGTLVSKPLQNSTTRGAQRHSGVASAYGAVAVKVQEGLFLGVCCTSSSVIFKASVVAETAASIDKSTKSDTERKVHARNERLGIAFNIVFCPKTLDDVALSEIPSTSSVSAAFNAAAAVSSKSSQK